MKTIYELLVLHTPSFDAIIRAAQQGNHAQFREWQQLERPLGIHQWGTSPLAFLAQIPDMEAIKVYIQHCPNEANKQITSALRSALNRHNFFETCQLLPVLDTLEAHSQWNCNTKFIGFIYNGIFTMALKLTQESSHCYSPGELAGLVGAEIKKTLEWAERHPAFELSKPTKAFLKQSISSGSYSIADEILKNILNPKKIAQRSPEENKSLCREIYFTAAQSKFYRFFIDYPPALWGSAIKEYDLQLTLNESLSQVLSTYRGNNFQTVLALLISGANPAFAFGLTLKLLLDCEDKGNENIEVLGSLLWKMLLDNTFEETVINYLKESSDNGHLFTKRRLLLQALARILGYIDYEPLPGMPDNRLDTLELLNCGLTDAEGSIFCEVLAWGYTDSLFYKLEKSAIKLKSLNLSYNKIGYQTGKSIASWLDRAETLVILNLSENLAFGGGTAFWYSGLQKVLNALHVNSYLHLLYLANTGLNDRDFSTLCELLKVNLTLKAIDCSNNNQITHDSKPTLQSLLAARFTQKFAPLKPVLYGTSLHRENTRVEATSFDAFHHEILHGLRLIQLKCDGAELFATKEDAVNQSDSHFYKYLVECLRCIPPIMSLALGSAAMAGAWLGVGVGSVVLKTLIDARYHLEPWMTPNGDNYILNKNRESEGIIRSLMKKLGDNTEHKIFMGKMMTRLDQLSKEFALHQLGERVAQQLSQTYQGPANIVEPQEAQYMGKAIIGYFFLFVMQSEQIDWASITDDFNQWLTHQPMAYFNVVLKKADYSLNNEHHEYYESKWAGEIIQKSGFTCYNKNTQAVSFDVMIKVAHTDEWVLTDGEQYGYRQACSATVNSLNNIIEAYDPINHADNNDWFTSPCGQYKLTKKSILEVYLGRPLRPIKSEFLSMGDRQMIIEARTTIMEDKLRETVAAQAELIKDQDKKIISFEQRVETLTREISGIRHRLFHRQAPAENLDNQVIEQPAEHNVRDQADRPAQLDDPRAGVGPHIN